MNQEGGDRDRERGGREEQVADLERKKVGAILDESSCTKESSNTHASSRPQEALLTTPHTPVVTPAGWSHLTALSHTNQEVRCDIPSFLRCFLFFL